MKIVATNNRYKWILIYVPLMWFPINSSDNHSKNSQVPMGFSEDYYSQPAALPSSSEFMRNLTELCLLEKLGLTSSQLQQSQYI